MHTFDKYFPTSEVKKDAGKIKWNDRSIVSYYGSLKEKDNDESFNVSQMFSPIARRAETTQSFGKHDFIPITSSKKNNQTYLKKYNQRKLNDSSPKKVTSPGSKSLINSIDSRFAIQSEPNSLTIDRSYYFNSEETDYNSIVNNKEADKEIGGLKLVKILCKLDQITYIKKVAFENMKKFLNESRETERVSFNSRQLNFIDMLIGEEIENQFHQKFHERKIDKVKIPYYNKLVGLCCPMLITKQRLKKTDRNVEEIKKEKEEQQKLIETPKSEKSFIFNFEITPKPPVDYEKRILKDSYSSYNLTSSKKENRNF